MIKDKVLLATLGLLITLSVLLTIAGVSAGDAGGGGGHDIHTIILPFL